MRYSGIQPQYFPRLHYFARILATDVFMIRDDVQFVLKHKYPDGKVDKSYQAHTPIKQAFGHQLLGLQIKHGSFLPIIQTKISYEHDWVENHLKTLLLVYSKANNSNSIYTQIEKILTKKYKDLASLNIATISWGLLQLLGKKEEPSLEVVNSILKQQKTFRLKEIRRASESKALKQNGEMDANEKIIALCSEVGAKEDYCGGTGLAAYVNHDLFAENGIKITVQDWKCQEYPQLYNKQAGFIPNLSIIDLLMNVDHKTAVKIING